jgi:peptidoglycan/LPS O-acetylase OafA/YrhL
MSSVIPYRPEIEGLSALAVVAVVLFHGGFRARR